MEFRGIFVMSPGQMENAVWENLGLIFDDMDRTLVPQKHLPAVMRGRHLASAGAQEREHAATVYLKSLHFSRKNLQTSKT